jgi:hypothetical protein
MIIEDSEWGGNGFICMNGSEQTASASLAVTRREGLMGPLW